MWKVRKCSTPHAMAEIIAITSGFFVTSEITAIPKDNISVSIAGAKMKMMKNATERDTPPKSLNCGAALSVERPNAENSEKTVTAMTIDGINVSGQSRKM